MRVAILTLPLWHNYGGILQAYALHRAVTTLGHEPTLLDVRRPAASQLSLSIGRIKRSLLRLASGRKAPWYCNDRELEEISCHTRDFVETRIQPKSAHLTIDAAMQMTGEFDVLIVGSDQVWRREYIPDLQSYVLMRAKDGPRRISYAASFGVSDWRFTEAETTLFADGLRRFQSISVREESGRQLLKHELAIEAQRVCDPTLLLDASHYCRLAGVIPRETNRIQRVFAYILDPDEERMTALSDVVSGLGGEVFSIMPPPIGPEYHKDKERYIYNSVENWIKAFNDSDFIITDSFHGCIFSIIFNRSFVAVINSSRGATRFESLLFDFNLQDRLFESIDEIDPEFLKPIDWSEVNSKLSEFRSRG